MQKSESKTSDFTYNLTDEKIAKYPVKERDKSKLLIYNSGTISENIFEELPSIISNNGMFVFNNTKVIQARLHFTKTTGALIEIFCLEPIFPTDYNLMFQSIGECTWKCIVGNSKKWKSEKLNKQLTFNNIEFTLEAERIETLENSQTIKFKWNNDKVSFSDILELIGETPIPPYLNRKSENSDKITYQTIYSKHKGSVAAPTAGLHFTENVLANLRKKNIEISYVTLHVGAGTFKPVKTETVENHEMHTEHFYIQKDTIERLLINIGNITAVGTTSVRSLESIYQIGIKILQNHDLKLFKINQWDAFELNQNISVEDSLNAVLQFMKSKNIEIIEAETQIMIVPGYKFKIVNKIITNFHQPQSTLLMLIAAFIGENWKNVYEYALKNNFRFLSYGDSSLLIP